MYKPRTADILFSPLVFVIVSPELKKNVEEYLRTFNKIVSPHSEAEVVLSSEDLNNIASFSTAIRLLKSGAIQESSYTRVLIYLKYALKAYINKLLQVELGFRQAADIYENSDEYLRAAAIIVDLLDAMAVETGRTREFLAANDLPATTTDSEDDEDEHIPLARDLEEGEMDLAVIRDLRSDPLWITVVGYYESGNLNSSDLHSMYTAASNLLVNKFHPIKLLALARLVLSKTSPLAQSSNQAAKIRIAGAIVNAIHKLELEEGGLEISASYLWLYSSLMKYIEEYRRERES